MKRAVFCCLMLLCAYHAIGQVRVTILINAVPKQPVAPNNIYLAGSFNMWKPKADEWRLLKNSHGIYKITFTIALGNYEYKFTRGSWLTGESGTKGTDVGNRLLHVVHDTTITAQITEWKDNYPSKIMKEHTASKNVLVLSEAFDMPQLGKQRRIWLYLPAGYNDSEKRYPVIYMHDGQNLFDEFTSGFGEWGVDEFLDSLKTEDQQFIVVGIDNGDDQRIAEYSPYDSEHAKASGDKYCAFLVETLKPFIDANYRTFADAKHTTIAGSSMGGLISMYAALKYPAVFGNAGIFSPAFWINPQIYDYATEHASSGSRYYFVCGDMESDKETEEMNKMTHILQEKGLASNNILSVVIQGAKHNEQQWKNDFPDFYRWLTGGL